MALLWCCCWSTAQAVDAAAADVDAAISAFAAAAAPGPARAAALARLAAFDDARVTRILLDALQQASGEPFAVRVLDAIGERPRSGVIEPLAEVLQRAGAAEPTRAAAAAAIARQGNRGIDLLLDLVRADGTDADVRVASMRGLAAAGDERAWRGLAPLALRGSTADRLIVLRLLDPAHGVAAVTQARLRLLQDSDPLLAAVAWRQLAGEGHAKARTAFEDLLERVGQSPSAAVRAELLQGLGHGLPADAYREFVRLAQDELPLVQTALRMVAGPLAADADFVRWLLAEVLDSKVASERKVALAIVAKAPVAVLQPLIDKVRAGLAHPTSESVDLALALGDLLAKDARWPDDVRRLLGAADPALRTAGFALLCDLGVGNAIEQAQHIVTAKEWELRSVAYRYLTRYRALASIPILIARVDKEDGRLEVELNNALFALTGVRCWRRTEWDAWWRKNQKTHALPDAATVAAGGDSVGGSTAAYYGIPLVSKRTVFLLDTSGSMMQKVGTDRQRTRLSEAVRQLRNVVEALPADQLFNVMVYAGDVHAIWTAMHKATADDRKLALDLLAKVGIGPGGTNIHAALELAFQDADVDTIYLLTDGEPTVGMIVDIGELADQVRRWNYSRQIVVHGIAVGGHSALLQRLAAESGGQYVVAR